MKKDADYPGQERHHVGSGEDRRHDEVGRLRDELRERDRVIQELRAALQAVYSSRTWKLGQMVGRRIHHTRIGNLLERTLDAFMRLSVEREKPAVRQARFESLIKKTWGITAFEEVRDPVKVMGLQFALSTVERGEHVRDIVSRHAKIEGKRYLDVGCAYGGFLTAFKRGGAREVVGIDVSAGFLEYARALLEDHGIAPFLHQKDILKRDDIRDLGVFDIITCNDVIEHVNCPDTALRHMASLLNQGGLLFMEIPNKLSASFIQSDGHYMLFGITLLPRWMADRYFERFFPSQQYGTGYRSLSYYLNTLRDLGLDCEVINGSAGDVGERLRGIHRALQDCGWNARTLDIDVSSEIVAKVRERVLRVLDLFERKYELHLKLRNVDPAEADALARKLILTFGENFWKIIARKATQ